MKKKTNDELVTRAYNVEFRTSDTEENVIEGIPIVFDSKTRIRDISGEFDEIISRTALDNANLKDVCLFINHDMNKIALARTRNGKGTLSLEVREDGVHIKAHLDVENNSEARALYSAVKRGDMDGMSFAFRIKKQNWSDLDKEVPTRTISEISVVHEVSVVNYPAYPQTSVSARSSTEVEVSPLAEARKAHAKEIASVSVELERLRNLNIMNL